MNPFTAYMSASSKVTPRVSERLDVALLTTKRLEAQDGLGEVAVNPPVMMR
jgi:hypothetical protein